VTAGVADALLVSETFGPTFQGEGTSLGRRALFIRLMRCNLSCRGCDTPYTWDATRFDLAAETSEVTVGDLLEWALGRPEELVVITGGEPLVQQRRLPPLVQGLVAAGRRVEVETNGTIAPRFGLESLVSQFTVSPKLARFGAGMPPTQRINPAVLAKFVATGRAVFKFVVSHPAELDEIAWLTDAHGLAPVFVMPEGTTAAEVTARAAALADPVLARGFHLTTRLHVLLWGDRRGR
jgi:organic radical activating enzyme